MKRLAALTLVLLACSAAFSGCQKSRLDGLVDAEGVVTLNGEPVAGATVLFAPKQIGGQAASAQATTDEKGAFKMTTLDPGDGVYPGEYTVTVMKDRVEGGLSPEEAKDRMDNPDKYRGQAPPPQTVVHELPVKYADLDQSGRSRRRATAAAADLRAPAGPFFCFIVKPRPPVQTIDRAGACFFRRR